MAKGAEAFECRVIGPVCLFLELTLMGTSEDLISTPVSGVASTPSTQKQAGLERKSYILPKDIANSLSHLSDRDFGLLLKACMKEKMRRSGGV